MKLAGQVTIGNHYSSDTPTRDVRETGLGLTFVFGRTLSLEGNLFGTRSASEQRFEFHYCTPKTQIPSPPYSLSWAPLGGVIRAQVFQSSDHKDDPTISFCRGILLSYRNGEQRALGHWRRIKDTVATYEAPSRIYLARAYLSLESRDGGGRFPRPQVLVTFSTPSLKTYRDPTHDMTYSIGWEEFVLGGVLEFLFDGEMHEANVFAG